MSGTEPCPIIPAQTDRSLLALGKAEFARGNLDSAGRWLEAALDINPDLTEGWCALGDCRRLQANRKESRRCFMQAITLDSGNADVLLGLGRLASDENNPREALEWLTQARGRVPESLPLITTLAACHERLDQVDEALECWRQARNLAREDAFILNNLGRIYLVCLGDVRAAKMHLTRALQLCPTLWAARLNLYQAQGDAGDRPGSIASMSRLLASPLRDDALFHRALQHLTLGHFAEGWRDYRSRWRRTDMTVRPFRYPEWYGEPMENQALLVFAEQGLGDEIMFASCLPDLLAHWRGQIILECDPCLKNLFQRAFPAIRVIGAPRTATSPEWLSTLPAIHRQAPIGDLPRWYRRCWADFPMHTGYLQAEPAKIARWKARLRDLGQGRKLGISWRGGKANTRGRLRSISLPDWLPVLELPDCQFVSLQYGDVAGELREWESLGYTPIHCWPEAIKDYDETAALIAALDGVITVCTAVAHLSGALGQTGWVLVPSIPEWRYLSVGETMPWYPSLRLVRQCSEQPWRELLCDLAAKLTDG